jgi:DNA replication protein DnaC
MTSLPRLNTDAFDIPSTDEASATWECPTCGPISPERRVASGGKRILYYKRMCNCVWKQQQAQYESARRREAMERRIAATFGGMVAGSYVYPYRKRTFNTFDESRQPEAFAIAQAFAEEPQGTLILYGPYGTGKTHLLAAICNTLIDKDIGCFFLKAPDLFDMLQTYMNKHWDYQDVIDRAIQTPLLVLDDIDKIAPSAWQQQKLYSIIDKRADSERPIALSTNLLDQLDTFVGGACASRLSIRQIAVEMSGQDYRKLL